MQKEIKEEKHSNKKAFVQLGLMILLTVITQFVMLWRASIIASKFGVCIEIDAFNFANNIGTFIFSFIGAGVTTILIPNMVSRQNKRAADIFISTLYLASFLILLFVYFGKYRIISGLSGGSAEFLNIACSVVLITLFTQFITSFLGVTSAHFQCRGNFNFPKFVNLVSNTILVIIILKMPNLTIFRYAAAILGTTLLNVFLQIFMAVKSGYEFKFILDFHDTHFIKMAKCFLPIMLSNGLYQLSLMNDNIIASRLGTGNISILTYSNSIMGMISALLLANVMIYLYPKIAESLVKDDNHKKVFDLFILLNAMMCLIVAGFFVVGENGIKLLYERGKFTPDMTNIVYICTLIYIIGLPVNALRDLIYKSFYAKGDTLTSFKNSLFISVVNIGISITLAIYIGIYGIIIGTVSSSFISLGMILYRFDKKFTIKYSKKVLLTETIKILIISAVVILIGKAMQFITPITNPILNIIVYGTLVIVMYIGLLYASKSKVFGIKL